MHKIVTPITDARHLTQAVLQIISLLGMYQAELARILGMQCSDIGEMASAKKVIQINSHAWHQASMFVRFYNRLYDRFDGDEAMMCHWLRRYEHNLSGSPFYLIVDEHKLAQVVSYMEVMR